VIEAGHSVLTMKTVVGKEYTRTPFFAARIAEVIVNPWWNVPDSIAVKELWPKQRRDPSYFAREHMVGTNGRIRQRPGEWNALGRLKFNMPNRYDVYLHDTPAKSLFDQPFRAFSHGCIRLERPLELALYLLRDQPRWTTAAIESDITAGTERAIRLTTPQPVYVLYWTAWVGDDGHMEFHRDHYERDAALSAALDVNTP
jgi:L,D-transpeptidase YcbB